MYIKWCAYYLLFTEDDIPERKIFTEHFKVLVDVLSTTNLYDHFIPDYTITVNDFEEISSYTEPRRKAELLLRKIYAAVDAGITAPFYSMLEIMETHGNIATKEQSTRIRQLLPPVEQSVTGNYNLKLVIANWQKVQVIHKFLAFM